MDKYTATWMSHSSISDYLACPRAYFLKNVYKDPSSGHKLQVVSPALSLGVAVHEVLESLSALPREKRFRESLVPAFKRVWQTVTGEAGGFTSEAIEKEYFRRGEAMLQRVMEHPGPLANLAVKIKGDLPYYYFSKEDNLILCGKLDWLEYDQIQKGVRIIDFKTGKNKERESSLQLPIYLLLATNCQKYPVQGASYWYLGLSDGLEEKELPDLRVARAEILEIGKRMALARKLKSFTCPKGGCPQCWPFERILKGEGKKVGVNPVMRRDSYLLNFARSEDEVTEEIL